MSLQHHTTTSNGAPIRLRDSDEAIDIDEDENVDRNGLTVSMMQRIDLSVLTHELIHKDFFNEFNKDLFDDDDILIMTTTPPFDLPTLRQHFSQFTFGTKQLPILYRLKSGIYYPYVGLSLVLKDLLIYSSTWNSSKLPLPDMTRNERMFYTHLCPDIDLSFSSKLILCSLLHHFLQLIDLLKVTKPSIDDNKKSVIAARCTMDAKFGSIREIDILNSEATSKYDNLRSTIFPSITSVKRHLRFDDNEIDLSSIGGYLQLDRCIYPYILSSTDLLLNFNDLRKPFGSTLHLLMPFFHSQSNLFIKNYSQIVQAGTRSIKKYKYYYQNIDDRFISLYHLLTFHRTLFFIQLFQHNRVSLKHLHEYYRSDFIGLLSKYIQQSGYNNENPYINGWCLMNSSFNNEEERRLATEDEILMFNWLLMYDNKCLRVHHQENELVLIKEEFIENIQLIENEHKIKRSMLLQPIS